MLIMLGLNGRRLKGIGNLFCVSDVCHLYTCFTSYDFIGGFKPSDLGYLLYTQRKTCFQLSTPVLKKKFLPLSDERVSFSQLLSILATPLAETYVSEH